MSTPVTSIRNIGPAMEEAFQRAGIGSAEELRDMQPDAAYKRLIETGTHPHFIGYYAMIMGLQGRPWNDCQGDEKIKLRQRFDKMCGSARSESPSKFAAELDRLGVRL